MNSGIIKEKRMKRKQDLMEEWDKKFDFRNPDHLKENIRFGYTHGFVPEFYHFCGLEFFEHDLATIEYHLRMLDHVKDYLTRLRRWYQIDHIAIGRIDNAITFNENIRGEQIFKKIKRLYEELKNAKTIKEMDRMEDELSRYYHRFYDEDGYVTNYIGLNNDL